MWGKKRVPKWNPKIGHILRHEFDECEQFQAIEESVVVVCNFFKYSGRLLGCPNELLRRSQSLGTDSDKM